MVRQLTRPEALSQMLREAFNEWLGEDDEMDLSRLVESTGVFYGTSLAIAESLAKVAGEKAKPALVAILTRHLELLEIARYEIFPDKPIPEGVKLSEQEIVDYFNSSMYFARNKGKVFNDAAASIMKSQQETIAALREELSRVKLAPCMIAGCPNKGGENKRD